MGCRHILNKIIAFLITFLVAFRIISQPVNSPSSNLQKTTSPAVTARTPTSTQPQTTKTPTATQVIPTATRDPQTVRPAPGSVCGFTPEIEHILNELEPSDWVNWIELLSGEKPVTMGGETYTIQTRFTESMFSDDPDARAYEFVTD